jgi:hypothetical protein
MGFLANSEWENFSKMDQMGETFPKSKMIVAFFSLWEKLSYKIFSAVGFFVGPLMGVKTPPKSHGVLCFKVRYLKNYSQYRCTFW